MTGRAPEWVRGTALLALAAGLSVAPGCDRRSATAREYPAEVTALATARPGLPYFTGPDMRPEWSPEVPRRGLGPFRMTDQLGRPVTSASLRGKVAVVSFFFSECAGICPVAMRNLGEVQKAFLADDRFVLLSFSITPAKDTPGRLREFARARGVDAKRWHLLTGPQAEIYRLARESFGADTVSPRENAFKKVTPDDFLHSENVYLVDAERHLRGVYSGQMVASLRELVRDARTLGR